MQRKALALREVKFAPPIDDTSVREFSGYGAVFSNIDSYDDIIAPGAFAASIAEHKAAGTMPVMLWNHDAMAMPIGVWTDLFEDDHGLKMSGRFLDTVAGRDAYTIARAGAVTGLSIGYIVTASELEKRDGKTVRVITEVKLIEVSLVTFPANDLARVNDVKSHMETEENMKLQRKSLERLAELFGEAKDLIDGLVAEADEEKSEVDDQAEDEESIEGEENSSDDPESEDEVEALSDEEIEGEAKYNLTARIEAVRNLTLAVKNLENHGR
ncbi:HK97 family phage prohead protease [Sphingobium sp. HT1-2]|jgi:HK97 family phage prohead protease|uniref:HK97 family phage prohead protease n=1 Tax=Sphingobium TaxID=165695 RepID=UPI00241D9323|nr:HK97 family phage prohead protease [Sphingobium yanoikuyae]